MQPRSSTKHPASTAPKRPRTTARNKAGNLKGQFKTCGLMDMPLELFVEISYNVLPADLIMLSRTCKAFRNILMRSTAQRIWASAEENLIGFPPYPWSNISKPRFAALIFTKSCSSCGSKTSSNVDPFLLVRLCSECRETKLVAVDDLPYSLRNLYSLVPKTSQIHFKKKDAEPRARGLGPPKYSLLEEFEEIQKMFKVLSQSGCTEEFQRWKEERIMEAEMRHEFGTDLQEYFDMADLARSEELEIIKQVRKIDILEKLRALGWTDREFNFPSYKEKRWLALVEQPRLLTDRVWASLLPKLTPLLEENRKRLQERDKEERLSNRKRQLHNLLRDLDSNTSVHPLGKIVEALLPDYSCDKSALSNASTKPVSEFLAAYPFPDTPTVLTWPFFGDIKTEEMDAEQVSKLFQANLEPLKAKIDVWRSNVELNLACRFTSAGSSKAGANYNVKINDTTDLTKNLSLPTRLLLRADSVFSRRASDSPNGQDEVLYYPEFVYKRQMFWSDDEPYQMSYRCYHPHVEGQKVIKTLLKSIGKPDVAYLELVAMGKRFICGRCYSPEAMDWKGMVRHHMDELNIWDVVCVSKPRFKTKHPIIMMQVHHLDGDEDGDDPFVRVLTSDEATKRQAEASSTSNSYYCAPCKNHGRSYVMSNTEAINDHLWNVHFVGQDEVKEGVHFGQVDEESTFLEVGGLWRDKWDKYYDELMSTVEGVD